MNTEQVERLSAEILRRAEAGEQALEGPELAAWLERDGALSRGDFKKQRRDHYSTQGLFKDLLPNVREELAEAYTLAGDSLGANEAAYLVVYVIDMRKDDDGKTIATVSAGRFKDHIGSPTRTKSLKDAGCPEDAILRWVDANGTIYESRAAYIHAQGKTVRDDVIVRQCKISGKDQLARIWLDTDGTPNAGALSRALAKLAEALPRDNEDDEEEDE